MNQKTVAENYREFFGIKRGDLSLHDHKTLDWADQLINSVKEEQEMCNKVDEKTINEFCDSVGAKIIWNAWYVGMNQAGRNVKRHQHSWETLSQIDKQLDGYIARRIVTEFIQWLRICCQSD